MRMFVACITNQNQANSGKIRHVTGNKIYCQKCCKTKLTCYRRRWHTFTRFVKNMLLLKSHEKTTLCRRSFPSMQKQPSRGVLRKSVREIYSKFTGEHRCRSVISLTWVFSCNFAVYFQSIIFLENLWLLLPM